MDKLTREELDERLDELAGYVPQMMAETDEASHMDAFAGIADEIREQASEEDRAHVWTRLQCILRDSGLIPGDEEPCGEG